MKAQKDQIICPKPLNKGAINIPFLFQMNKKHIQKCLFMNKNTFL
jgi:hypothetical protein